jgi:hypothetical protein
MTPEPDQPIDPPLHDEEIEDPGWPWSFILLVVAGGLYLVLRFVQLAMKLLQ